MFDVPAPTVKTKLTSGATKLIALGFLRMIEAAIRTRSRCPRPPASPQPR